MAYLKPQTPLKDLNSGDYFYPLTTIDQIITGTSRLSAFLSEDSSNHNLLNLNNIGNLNVNGTSYFNNNATFNGHVLPNTTNTYDLGSSSSEWKNIYATTLNATCINYKSQWVDLSSLNQNTYYPVTGSNLPYGGYHMIKVSVQLNSGTVPSWSTHGAGFTVNLLLYTTASGWGTTASETIVLDDYYGFANAKPVSYTQNNYSSTPVLWMRGGGKYEVWTDYDCTWTVRTSTYYTYNSGGYTQTVAPQSSLPSIPVNGVIRAGTINGNLTGNNGIFSNLLTIGSSTLNTSYNLYVNGTSFFGNEVYFNSNMHWKVNTNWICDQVTANNQEWSFDMNSGSYTGCYWHVWSTKNGGSCLQCFNDDRHSWAFKLYGAVWNDYAEFRETKKEIEPGRCIVETGQGDLILSTKRMQEGCEIVSDTFGFAIGQSKKCNTPTAASGRVLAFPYENKELFKPGKPVCSGPNGTISVMTEEEAKNYPWCIIGTVSEIPNYTEWQCGDEHTKPLKVNGRIWIRIR